MEISARVNHDGTIAKEYTVGKYGNRATITRNYSGHLTPRAKDLDAGAYYIKVGVAQVGITLSENQMLEFFSAFLAIQQEYEEANNGTD